jgi:flagellar FliL protein
MGTMAPTTTTPAAVAPEKTNPTNVPAGTVPAEPMVEATVVRVSSSAPPAKAKMPMGKIFAAMLLAVVVGAAVVGGGVFYLAKTGRLGVGATAPVFETHALVLDSMLVNLSDGDGAAYLKVGITLRVVEQSLAKNERPSHEKGARGMSEEETAVRDTVLTVLGQQTSDELLAPDGKEALKVKLRAALTEHNTDIQVTELYFTEFLVQR